MNAKAPTVTGCIALEPSMSANTKLFHAYMKHKRDAAATVSYTHLTLPTNPEV